MSDYEHSPFIEGGPVTDVYIDGIQRIEVCGDNARMIFFRLRGTVDGLNWEKVAADIAIVRPVRSLKLPLSAWPNVLRIKPMERTLVGVH